MKSRLKYDLSIFFRWGMVSMFCFILTLPSTILPNETLAWEMSPDKWDKRKLRNNWTYLVEGKAGMGVILGEKEDMVLRILGQPTRRSYTTLDELYFERRTFSGMVYLYRGMVTRLRYEISDRGSESLKWKTALGLTQQSIENLSENDAKKVILNFYKNPGHLEKSGSLLIYTLGIQFKWSNDRLRTIEIFIPWSGIDR